MRKPCARQRGAKCTVASSKEQIQKPCSKAESKVQQVVQK
jgi:hypothetical protein